jgi:hypothetical protein
VPTAANTGATILELRVATALLEDSPKMRGVLVFSLLLSGPLAAQGEMPVVMGVQLGQVPPNYGTCNFQHLEKGPCYTGSRNVRVVLSDKWPPFVTSFELHLADDGTVDGMDIGTHGVADQGVAYLTLTQKFGEPTKRVDGRAQNLYGANFETISAFWVRQDYEVDFLGTTADLTKGDIALSTTALHNEIRRHVQSKQSPF